MSDHLIDWIVIIGISGGILYAASLAIRGAIVVYVLVARILGPLVRAWATDRKR